jgi:hypothetical protein
VHFLLNFQLLKTWRPVCPRLGVEILLPVENNSSNGGFIPEKTIFFKFLAENRLKIRFLGLLPEQ